MTKGELIDHLYDAHNDTANVYSTKESLNYWHAFLHSDSPDLGESVKAAAATHEYEWEV